MKRTKGQVMDIWYMPTMMHMRECGRKIYPTVKEYILGNQVRYIGAILSVEFHMEEVRNHILVGINIMESGHMGRNAVPAR